MDNLTNFSKIMNAFWSSFGLTAYDESTVPTGDNLPTPPYITYDVVMDGFDSAIAANASLWYRDSSWADITAKADAIFNKIGSSGIIQSYGSTTLWIKRAQPFAQRRNDESDDTIRRILLNIEVENLTE